MGKRGAKPKFTDLSKHQLLNEGAPKSSVRNIIY